MSQRSSLLKKYYKYSLASIIVITAISAQAAPTVTNTDPAATPPATNQNNANQSTTPANNTLAAQLQPSDKALSDANQALLSRNAQLQRQVNDLQTQVNVLVYESKGQLFLYGAFTVLISLLVGIFVSWLVFVRRERW
ncbi:hypothetical protein [Psychrobacter sp. P2G3]|uniref:hypothetical protein n=1 Tax=Psychrobacter sp. P2G3 TaxID=1699622 RepID=UPI00078ED113|nr:hypothetical protein [Psychrobacter sp. P2G3]AMN50311.1 hypothetical protein AK823_10885 [Psychrobacter sp. P2G3]